MLLQAKYIVLSEKRVGDIVPDASCISLAVFVIKRSAFCQNGETEDY